MNVMGGYHEVRGVEPDTMTHINLGGIRYLPLVPAPALRRAVQEYLAMRPILRCAALRYLAEHPSVVLCREDCEKVRRVAVGAATDLRLSPESRRTFAQISNVLSEAFPWSSRDRAFSA